MSEGAVVVDFFNRAQECQRQGRWREALALVEEGHRKYCHMCTWWLSHIYDYGYWGKTRDKNKSESFLKRASDLGNQRAELEYFYNVGHFYMWSRFSDPYVLGECHLYGKLGCVRDSAKAKLYFEKCKDSFGKAYLAYCTSDNDECLVAKQTAAAEGNPCHQHSFAQSLSRRDRITEAIVWYRKAAEQEHVNSQKFLYKYFMKTCYNPVAGRYWYKRLKQFPKSYIVNQDQLFDAIEKCQRACFQLILIRKCRRSLLSMVAKDVVIMIAKMLWQTWSEDCWKVRKSDRLKKRNE